MKNWDVVTTQLSSCDRCIIIRRQKQLYTVNWGVIGYIHVIGYGGDFDNIRPLLGVFDLIQGFALHIVKCQ